MEEVKTDDKWKINANHLEVESEHKWEKAEDDFENEKQRTGEWKKMKMARRQIKFIFLSSAPKRIFCVKISGKSGQQKQTLDDWSPFRGTLEQRW